MNLTLLELNQIFGEDKLKVIEKYGTKAAITDFAILLGGYVSDLTVNNSKELKHRTGWYWTKTDDGDNDARVVLEYGNSHWLEVSVRNGGCRPALPFSSISGVSSNVVRGNDEILRVEYGEYPQYVVSNEEQSILESLYRSNSLNITGKTYTTDSRKWNEYNKGFSPTTWEEYEYNGRKFVRVIANSDFGGNEFQLSNGEMYKDGDAVWVEVSPIKWIVDEEEDIAISERLIVSEIQFNKKSNYKGDFTKTDMYNFMNTYLVKDIVPSKLSNPIIVNEENLIQLDKKIEELNTKINEMQKLKDEIRELIRPISEEKTKRLK